jgi:hypothetical protein
MDSGNADMITGTYYNCPAAGAIIWAIRAVMEFK